jgi:hypothetical protein
MSEAIRAGHHEMSPTGISHMFVICVVSPHLGCQACIVFQTVDPGQNVIKYKCLSQKYTKLFQWCSYLE